MPWYDSLYQILDKINTIILIAIGVPFSLQLINMLLFWIPKRKYPKSERLNHIAIMIPAHNEEDVIYDTVKDLFDNQDYPRELFDVYVIADNCTDRTAELAKKAGANVLIHTDPDPKHHMVGFALQFGFQELLKLDEEKHYDYLIRLDADNHVNNQFFKLMNDAYNYGAEMARPYESALNITQNNYTKACALYYTFDSRCAARVREFFNMPAHCNGPGCLISMRIIRRLKGYDTVTMCEDSEFNLKRIFEGIRPRFVEDAVVYEDLPSTLKDTYRRNRRLGAGNTRLFFRYTPKMWFYTFKNLDISIIFTWLTYIFIPLCPIFCIYLPGYYIYAYIYHFVRPDVFFEGTFLGLQFAGYGADWNGWIGYTTTLILTMVGFLFVFAGILQATLMVLSDYKKMGAEKRRQLIPGILLFPLFAAIYVVTVTIGIFLKPKWEKISRNPQKKIETA